MSSVQKLFCITVFNRRYPVYILINNNNNNNTFDFIAGTILFSITAYDCAQRYRKPPFKVQTYGFFRCWYDCRLF
jgi:hypothetical protein